jgi:hypothetical protein
LTDWQNIIQGKYKMLRVSGYGFRGNKKNP